jgi:cell division GTPase FtsZ
MAESEANDGIRVDFSDDLQHGAKIKVIGVGGGGGPPPPPGTPSTA